jgi:hypothetical protein
MCVGNFNKILDLSEKSGACERLWGQMEAFKKTLEDCQLCNLGFFGPKFTWNNGWSGHFFTWVG